MTTIQLARRAVRAWPHHSTAERSTTNHIRRQWLRSVEILGPKWRAKMGWTREDQKKVEEVAA